MEYKDGESISLRPLILDRKRLSCEGVFRVCVRRAGTAVLAVAADPAEVYSVGGVFELAAPGTVLPLQPFWSIPTGQRTIPYTYLPGPLSVYTRDPCPSLRLA